LSLYLAIAGAISQATLLRGGDEPRSWPISADEFAQLTAELGHPIYNIVGTPLHIQDSESSLGETTATSAKAPGLNEDRDCASAAELFVSATERLEGADLDLGAQADSEPPPWKE